MKFFLIFIFFLAGFLSAQNGEFIKGEVTYLSSRHIYIKFDSTEGFSGGDTLFYSDNGKMIAALVIRYKSSSSVAAENISQTNFSPGSVIYAKETKKTEEKVTGKEAEKKKESREYIPVNRKKREEKNIRGKFSLNSYSFQSNLPGDKGTQRWKYRFSLSADKLYTPKLSFDSYMIFRYRTTEWEEVSKNPGDALKIYSFNLGYRISDKVRISAGRKINRKISNLGAYDGLDAEYHTGNNYFGIVAGSRPDFTNYGYNIKLFQYGLYYARKDSLSSGPMENSVSVVNQTNNFNTDRRFIYFQHTNYLIPDIFMFVSGELDLYKRENGVEKNSLSFTGSYISLRYSERPLSITLSYDARKNVIYYETYKSFADSLLDTSLRQGFRTRINYRLTRKMNIGITGGFRSKEGDAESSKNYGAFFSYSYIPYLRGSASVSINSLNTPWIDGIIAGIRLSKEINFILGSLTLNYRNVNYQYSRSDYTLKQNIISIDLNSGILSALNLFISYEGIFEEKITYTRFYTGVNYRI